MLYCMLLQNFILKGDVTDGVLNFCENIYFENMNFVIFNFLPFISKLDLYFFSVLIVCYAIPWYFLDINLANELIFRCINCIYSMP